MGEPPTFVTITQCAIEAIAIDLLSVLRTLGPHESCPLTILSKARIGRLNKQQVRLRLAGMLSQLQTIAWNFQFCQGPMVDPHHCRVP
jgi:hypothetical protein